MPDFILSLDQGTTSSRAILFDRKGQVVSIAQKEFTQFYPQPGWVEHDPVELWSSRATVLAEVFLKSGARPSQVAAIGITNQRETTLVWDRRTGKPVCNAIVWQDRRTAAYCDSLKEKHEQTIREKTGLVMDAYFSASKVKWILDHVKGAREKAEAGELVFGTVDTWLVWNLTGGMVRITDVTNASRTMLYNIHSLSWDDELLNLFTIPRSMLPEVRSSSKIYGETTGNLFPQKIPIAGIAGDQQAALFGQLCTNRGMVKNTYGTGCFMLMNIGEKPTLSSNNLVTTIAWKLNGKVEYALEGSIFIAGALVQWLRDELGILSSSGQVESLARTVDNNNGVYIVPAFAGLGAPHWNPHARGTIVGLTRGTTAAHLSRAALESIALQTMDVLRAMEADSGSPVKELRVDGGATVNDLLMQIQADVLGVRVARPKITETTAMGAAYLAGLATGFWKDISEIGRQWELDREFIPSSGVNKELIGGWMNAVKTTIFQASL